MKKVELYLPELGLIAATRGMLGAGLGLLLAPVVQAHRRRTVGWALLAVGALSTIPLGIDIVRKARHVHARTEEEPGGAL